MSFDEQLYTAGFNAGYLLARHEPKLLNALVKAESKKHDYIQGLKDGKMQYEKELLLEQMKNSKISKGKER